MKYRSAIAATAFVFGAAAGKVFAEDSLFDLPLEQLVQQTVTVASMKADYLGWTPSSVTRYSRQQMQQLGVRSLPDILALVPGVVIQRGLRGNELVMVRGIVDDWNQKVLFLLNDTPYWMPSHGEIPIKDIPMAAIDHVEVIRGPGAVVHGSNATAAVIKVVTRQGLKRSAMQEKQPEEDLELVLASGSDSATDAQLFLAGQVADDALSVELGLQRWRESAIDTEVENTIRPPFEGSFTLRDRGESGLLRIQYHDLALTLHRFEREYTGIDGPSAGSNIATTRYQGQLSDLTWSWRTGEWQGRVFSNYNQFYFETDVLDIVRAFGIDGGDGVLRFDDDAAGNYRWHSGFVVQRWLDKSLLTIGYDYEIQSTESLQSFAPDFSAGIFSGLIDDQRAVENSTFAQLDLDFDNWRIVAGVRYVDFQDNPQVDWLPRLSLMYRLTAEQTLRLMFGEGYNNPSFAQGGSTLTNLILPFRELREEKIRTTELAYHIQSGAHSWDASVFYYETLNFLDAVFDRDNAVFVNAENYRRYGGESSYRYQYQQRQWFFNLAYLHQGDRRTARDPDALLVPRYSGSLGYVEQFGQHSLGVSLVHYSQRRLATQADRLRINYQYHTGPWRWQATLGNVLDDELVSPDSRTTAIIREDRGRQYLLSMTYTLP